MKISFAKQPAVGLAVNLDRQRFDLIGIDDYIKLDGSKTKLLVWQSLCPACGEMFVARSPTSQMPGTRRCSAHRQPGKRVRGAA